MQSVEEFHLQEEQLERYSLGKLPESEMEPLEEHLLICHNCQDKLAEVDAYVAAVKAAALKLQHEPPSLWDRLVARVPEWFTSPLPAGAALAAAGIVLALILVRPWDPGSNGMVPATVVLHAMRGAEESGVAPAGRPLEVRLHLEEHQLATAYRAEIADAAGRIVFSGVPLQQDEQLALQVQDPLPPGAYWVRLYNAGSGAFLREYDLQVR